MLYSRLPSVPVILLGKYQNLWKFLSQPQDHCLMNGIMVCSNLTLDFAAIFKSKVLPIENFKETSSKVVINTYHLTLSTRGNLSPSQFSLHYSNKMTHLVTRIKDFIR